MNSLRVRILLLFLLALLPIAALTVHEPLNARAARLHQAELDAARQVEIGALAQRELLIGSRRYLSAIAKLPQLAASDTLGCLRTVKLMQTLIDEGWSVSRVRANGVVDCVSNTNEADKIDTFVVQHANELMHSDSGLIGPYRRSNGADGPKEPLSTAYVAIHDSAGNYIGALSMRRKMRWLADLARDIQRDSQAVVTLLDSTGFVYAQFPDAAGISGTRPTLPATKGEPTRLRPLSGMHEMGGVDTIPRLYAFDSLPSAAAQPVFLNIGVAARPIIGAANAALFRSIAWLLLWVSLTIVCAWWAAERVVLRDIRALLSATERLGQGDLAARTGLRAHSGELGQLANAFDNMAQQLEERQERLAQAQKMESVGQLAGGVAHDFNNLLTAIIGNAELAREHLPPAHPARDELRHVLDAAERSGKLTRQLLAFARRHTMDVHVLSLDELLGEVTSLLQRVIGEHITLNVASDAKLQPTRIDPTQFEQLIMNLAVNARDAMPHGGTLTLGVHNVIVKPGDQDALQGVPPGPWVALTVTDTGTGMNAEVVRRAFEPFYTTKGVGEGTGLGLAVVYGTVQQHSGHIRIYSAMGRGTTVRILLPPSTQPVERLRTASPTPARSQRGNEQLLLVEDEAAVRAVSARLLRNNGYVVREAVDGADAMQQMQEGKLANIALLVTDVVMPRMGGPELASALRKQRPSLPVLLVSGYSESGIPDELMRTPSTIFVEKPFSTDALLSAVRRLLDER